MKLTKQIIFNSCYMMAVFAALLVLCPNALAAEAFQGWRPIYDLAMRWLNFLIIVFVLIKFGRKPIKDFLTNRREEIDYQIKKYEQQKDAAEQKVLEARKMLDDHTIRFEKIKQRIIEDGENSCLFDSGNLEEAIHKGVRLLSEADFYLKISKRGIETAREKFSLHKIIDQYEQVYFG